MEKQENMTPAKEHNFPVTDPKVMENCDLPDKEFKIIVLRELGETQVITQRQFNKIRKKKSKQKEV